MASPFVVTGSNDTALFTLKIYRGEGMSLLAMNWRKGQPPNDFVGFAIEYQEPGGDKYYPLTNRLCFPGSDGSLNPNTLSTRLSPIQKFRWVHFPRNATLDGEFLYKVTPVFMDGAGQLSYGVDQEAAIVLAGQTYPGALNVGFTRGFVSSQAFVDYYGKNGSVASLLPANAAKGLTFTPTNPDAPAAYDWMGFEARKDILAVLDAAIADKQAQVRAIAYDFDEPEVVSRLVKLGKRLKVIIDNSGSHGKSGSAENGAETMLKKSAGAQNVKRQHMGSLQHNKTITVDGPAGQAVVCGSTNFSWRGFFVQANNALVIRTKPAVDAFNAAFDNYWQHSDDVAGFGASSSTAWLDLGVPNVDMQVSFSPHGAKNARLSGIADDIEKHTTSNLLYSLAFLYQTKGAIRDAIGAVTANDDIFVYGISDRPVGGLDVQKPDGNVAPVSPAALGKNTPEPFKSEPTGGGGIRMHHKFVVIDFDKPTARVYMGSYNFSGVADGENGENLLVIRDQRVAVSYMVEALRLFDHYHFRLVQADAKKAKKTLSLARPPKKPGELAWWADDYSDVRRARDRELFA